MSLAGTPGPRDDLAVVTLASGGSYAQAAKDAGLSERTIKRRMAEPGFRRRVADARAEMVRQTVGALTVASLVAVRTLTALVQPSSPPSVRLGAAKALLEAEPRYRESEAIEDRLADLESAMSGDSRIAS